MRNILFVLALAVGLLLTACTDESASRRTLRNHGFTNVQITGYMFFSCGGDDFSSTGFIARNAKGRLVRGVVCCGLVVKGCTIRF